MSAVVRMQTVTLWEINPGVYVGAAVKEGELDPDEREAMLADTGVLAERAVDYCDPGDLLPRWARSALRVTDHITTVIGGAQ